MRLAADENVHRKVIEGLRLDGHDVAAVIQAHPSAKDLEILAWAREEKRVLITSDRDFGKLLVAEGETTAAGVIYLRIPRLAVTTTLDRLREVLKADRDISGQLVVIAPAGDRWRTLSS